MVTAENVYEALFEGINGQFEHAQQLEGRDLIDAVSPDILYQVLHQGISASEQLPLEPRPRAAIKRWHQYAARSLKKIQPRWEEFDARDRGLVLESMWEGATSETTTLGAQLGSFFGPLGATVGAVAGAMLAGTMVESQRNAAAERYLVGVDKWWEGISAEFKRRVIPSFGPRSYLKPLVAVAALALFAWTLVDAYNLWPGHRQPAPSAKAAAVPPPAVQTTPRIHATRMRSKDGREFGFEDTGTHLILRVLPESKLKRFGYKPGEVYMVLRRIGPVFALSLNARPKLPRRTRLRGSKAYKSCSRVVGPEEDKDPMFGVYKNGELRIDYVELKTTTKNFVRRGRSIRACRGLKKAPLLRRQMFLRPVR